MESDSETRSKHYFSNISTLAKKIAIDIQNTQEAYQDFWHSLSKKEQDQVIDESIISPRAVIKYANLQLMTAKENPNVYSWFTKSQLNLFNPNLKIETQNSETSFPYKYINRITNETFKDIEKSTSETGPLVKYKESNFEDKLSINSNKTQTIAGHKISVLKPKTPPPPPPPSSKNLTFLNNEMDLFASEPDSKSNVPDIPKTGFDFLDNW